MMTKLEEEFEGCGVPAKAKVVTNKDKEREKKKLVDAYKKLNV